MFRVSAPPKPQTPGPSRPAPPAPHEGRPGVNKRLGDGGSPGSMPAGRFHSEKVVESFLGQRPLAGLPPLADGSGVQRGGGGNLRCSPGAEERHRRGVCRCQLAALPHPLHGQPAHPSAQARPTRRGYPGPSRMVRTIYQQLSPAEVHGQLDRVVEQLREPFPQVAEPWISSRCRSGLRTLARAS